MKPKKNTVSRKPIAPVKDKINSVLSSVFICASAVYAAVLLMIHAKINEVQPIPYLDEIYHVPQAQEYCRGNFSHWDNRITTLPGLYLISVSVVIPISNWLDHNVCETQHLRLTNVVLSLGNFFLYVWLTWRIHHEPKDSNHWKGLASALNIAFFPPLFFFSFLYYTDVAAAFLVFLMYTLHIYGKHKSSAVAGIAAVLVRQTSIVWVILVAVDCLDLSLQDLLLSAKDRKRDVLSCWRQVQVILKKFFSLSPMSRKLKLVGQLISQLFPYILVGLLFAAFVVINNGLVVGDRNAHQATVNIPQLFYLFGLVALFASAHWLPYLLPFSKTCLKKWYWVLLAAIMFGVIVRYNTLVHPYLLADNRHCTFYIWKRVFEYQPWGRYAIIPLYLFGSYVTYRTMSSKKSFIFALAFIVCCFVALVPQRLLEIRYLFIPFLFVRWHIVPRSWLLLVMEFLMYALLNAASIYLFITRPFYWSDSDLVQRFMW